MIKINSIKDIKTEIEISFTPQVKTYNISTALMSDECKPYRIAQSTMIWITQDGYLGEIECIYTEKINKTQCKYSQVINQVNGFPQLEINTCDNEVLIQDFEGGFIIWLSRDKLINTKVSYGDLIFLLSEKELVAIVARHIMI